MIATPLPKLVNLRKEKEKDSDSRFMGQECTYKAIVEDPLVLRRGHNTRARTLSMRRVQTC